MTFLKPHKASHHQGFTLVELVVVLVILGVVSALGTSFFVSMVDSYHDVQRRTKLINRGRLVIEQMARQLRIALPNSVRVSATGNCIEFLPVVSGTSYFADVPDAENLAPLTNSIATAPFELGLGTFRHASVGGLDASEIYAAGNLNARVDAGTLSGSAPYTSVPLATTHRFIRNSINRRVFLADDPLRFCLIGNTLLQYSGYDFPTGTLNDIAPNNGNSDIMAEGVSTGTRAFTLSLGSEDINTSVDIDMDFSRDTTQVRLRQQVLVRNVP